MNKQEWSAALESFVRVQHQRNPIPDRANLSEEEEWHCRIIGGEFISWYRQHLQDILSQRMALQVMNFDPQPIVVFTTSIPGLVAARQILPEPPENFVYLLHSEFEKWQQQHPVDEFIFHVHHYSYFCPIGKDLLTRARKVFPEVEAELGFISVAIGGASAAVLRASICGAGTDREWNYWRKPFHRKFFDAEP